eukprot:CAMPEP_0172647740 /NCGR_PEP_ID=MMETSP1068-20121228/240906_1 /TAXON_ID=35684 /ORGANISM="Pseudopedinella elastica, Strain CCMP716" /LENGTH=119 /DNA_ID=CAMNT_0013462029 /DNA_START=146 /DNA_END=505 /DNA_ORIENTATION=-
MTTRNPHGAEARARSCLPRANVYREVRRDHAGGTASVTSDCCGSLISTEPREAQAPGPPHGENPVRGAAPRESNPGRHMQPPLLQPQARPARETAPPGPSKPTPRGESTAKYLQKDWSG